jgi:predicted transcriptional regulator
MPRKRSETLTEGEQRLMEVLWKRGSATVAEVLEALPERERPAFNTVQTMLRIMEKKGYLRHEERGRAFIYHAKVERDDAGGATVWGGVGRFFLHLPKKGGTRRRGTRRGAERDEAFFP